MGTTQLNVRLDEQLKKDVDEALAAMGRTATDTIRLLWQYIESRKTDLKEADAFLLNLEQKARQSNRMEGQVLARTADDIYMDFCASLNINRADITPVIKSDEELYEEALLERMKGRGLYV